jgi:hypothetical protein
MNRKHFMIFRENNQWVIKKVKDWAREHPTFFPTFTFENSANTPTTSQIEAYLISNLDFRMLSPNEDQFISICLRLD